MKEPKKTEPAARLHAPTARGKAPGEPYPSGERLPAGGHARGLGSARLDWTRHGGIRSGDGSGTRGGAQKREEAMTRGAAAANGEAVRSGAESSASPPGGAITRGPAEGFCGDWGSR